MKNSYKFPCCVITVCDHVVKFSFSIALAVILFLSGSNVMGQVTYTQQTGNYYSTPTTGTSGNFNQGSYQLGMYSHGTSPSVVSFRKFRTDASGSSTGNRALQVGDVFTVTLSACRAYGRIGCALLASPSCSNAYSCAQSNYAIQVNLDGPLYNGGSTYGVWYIRNGASSTYASSFGGNQGSFHNFTFIFTLTAPDRMNVTIQDNTSSLTYTQNDILLNTSAAITDYSVYFENDYDGAANQNMYWGQGAVSTQGSLLNNQSLPLGLSNNTFAESVVIPDGLVASSTSTNSPNSLSKNGSGTLTLSGANTYTGTTTLNAGTLQLGAANTIPSSSNVILSGGTLSSGATSGYSNTMGTLQLTANTTLALGTGSHTLSFANSSGVSWTSGKTITVTGWTGSAGASGTVGKIFFGSGLSTLTTSQLTQIIFSGYGTGGAMLLGTGEVVPVPAPVITSVVGTTPSVSGQATNTGYIGQLITINGTNLSSASAVTVGGTSVTGTAGYTNSATQITFTLAAGVSGTVSVTTANGTGTQAGFTNLGYITNTNSADYNTAATWLGGTLPPASSLVTINNTGITISGASNSPNTLTILSGAALTINNTAGAITATTVSNSGTLAFTAAGTLTIAASGTLTNAGTFTAGTGTVSFSGAATVNGSTAMTFNNMTINTGTVTLTTVPTINGTLQINGGNVSASPNYGSSSTLNYNGGASYTAFNEWATGITSGAGVPNHVTLTTSGTSLNFGTAGSYHYMKGNLSIASGTTLALSTASGGDLKMEGNFALTTGGTFTPNTRAVFFTGGSQQTISRSSAGTIGFDYIINSNTSGGIKLSTGTNININAPSGGNGLTLSSTATPIDLNGNIMTLTASQSINTTGANTITSTSGTGQVWVAVSTTCTVSGTGTLVFSSAVNVVLKGTSGSMNFGSGITTINGTLELDAGSFVSTNAPTYGTGSTLLYNTGGSYSRNVEFGSTSGPGYPYNVVVQGGTFLDLSNLNPMTQNIACAGDLTISGTSSGVGLNTSTHTLTVNGNVTIGTGTNGLYLSSASGGDIQVGGNWIHSGGTFNNASRAVYFIGSGNSTITASGGETFAYLFINKSSATNTVTLSNDITVSSVLNLTKGLISTGSNKVILSSTASGAVTAHSSLSYIYGNLRRNVVSSTSYDFPVGTSSAYELANITFGSGLAGTTYLDASFNSSISGTTISPSTCIVNNTKMSGMLNGGIWSIVPDAQPTAGTYDVTLNMNGFSNTPSSFSDGHGSTVSPAQQIALVKRHDASSPWQGCGTNSGVTGGGTHTVGSSTLSGSSAMVKRTGVTSFSDFGVGTQQSTSWGLPVELIYFNAQAKESNAALSWATASEINNDHFDIESSVDGINFTKISQVKGNGNTTQTITYEYTDTKLTTYNAPVVYYRLKQVDYDGHFKYTNIASVNVSLGKGNALNIISTFPNPFVDHFTVSYYTSVSQPVKIAIYSITDELMSVETVTSAVGLNIYQASGINKLAPGFYTVTMSTGPESHSFKIMKGQE